MSDEESGCAGCFFGCGFMLAVVIVIAFFGSCSARRISEGWHEGRSQEGKR